MLSINFTILKLTFYFIIGILLSKWINFSLNLSLNITICLLVIVGTCILLIRSSLRKHSWLTIIIYTTIISTGYLTTRFHNSKQYKTHYTHLKSVHKDSTYTLQYKIIELLKPSLYHEKYIIKLQSLNGHFVSGKLLLNVKKDTLPFTISIDDIYVSKTKLKPLNLPLNPHQFNYKKYLNKKNIYNQLSISKTNFLKIDSTKHSLVGYASFLREMINKKLKTYHFSKDELAILNALLLGQRQDISKDIYKSYTKAGAIHILAVSGLHVGIILMLLHYLFRPLDYLNNGKVIKTITIVFLLWCYAFIAGLSPSVVRAVSMFTVFAIAMNLKRPTNIYNTVAISILFLLLFKPSLLFDVGFQMSYLAVLAIVTVEPMLNKLWKPKFKVLSFFWKTLTVTLAAQIGVVPISLFYFHQFPGLFFLSNLVIIPCLGIILGFGILVIVFALLNLLPNVIAILYGYIISLLNSFVNWISLQESFIFQNISFNIFNVTFSYLLIVSVIRVLKLKTFTSLLILLVSILSFQGYLFFEKYWSNKSSITIFHKSRHSIIGFQNDKALHLYHSLSDSLIKNETAILNYKIGESIKSIKTDSLRNAYSFNEKTILIIDSLGIYTIKHHKPDFILLRNSPKINLVRLIDSLHPELIISDGSNYRSYQERWHATCKAKKISFHQTSEKGAFIYR